MNRIWTMRCFKWVVVISDFNIRNVNFEAWQFILDLRNRSLQNYLNSRSTSTYSLVSGALEWKKPQKSRVKGQACIEVQQVLITIESLIINSSTTPERAEFADGDHAMCSKAPKQATTGKLSWDCFVRSVISTLKHFSKVSTCRLTNSGSYYERSGKS